MKKTNYLLVLALCVVLISCGGKSSGKNDEKEDDLTQASASDCLISELENLYGKKDIVKTGSKEPFTGIAVTKDQSDSIIKKIEVKKGWLVREIIKEKSCGKYFTISDLDYEDTKIKSGFELKIDKTDSNKGFYNIGEYKEYKNGKDFTTWVCSINPEINQIEYKWGDKDGVSGSQLKPSGCMKDYYQEYNYVHNVYNVYYTDRESNEEYNRILEGLKKELPHFDYWKEK